MKKTLAVLFALLMIAAALPASAKQSFSDVEETRWSAASIEYAVRNGYMKGVGGEKLAELKDFLLE